ncbi:Replicase RepFR55 [Bacillus pseudomycoides]|uniref:Replicase RepFR55 n=1 Tax=Bacillus pseudomycoides TaxID=64104 RepID=UPI000BED5DBF|nr:Replicase RepFR55 [Bacillus pseudomycoides]PED72727.1 Replicase RepFR55 [Bacillus pseudomycoides]PGC33830.1 Replicase RepFR55 [Bacillus pseudomycoides]PHB02512.1 Replicase RepFR55 [Bacillus pseudomycoides]
MLLQNFLLSKAKAELSPHLYRIAKWKTGAINQAVKSVIKDIDSILLDLENVTTKEFFAQTPRRYAALEVVLSYLVQEGYSQMRQVQISKKSGISVPLVNFILNWLEDLEVCHQIKTRRHNKIAPSIYILSLHNNYLKIVEYFKQKWALTIDVFSTFTEFLARKINKKQKRDSNRNEDTPVSTCHGFDLFTPIEEEPEKQVNNHDNEEQENNPKLGEKLKLRFNEMDEYMTEDQKKLYMYILSQDTNIAEKDAYIIALRMPPDMDLDMQWVFKDCVEHFQRSKSNESTPAHFITMFSNQLKKRRERKRREFQEEIVNKEFGKPFESTINFVLFQKGIGFKK